MDIISTHTEADGKYIETYRAKARKGGVNYMRAAGHGVLDVATLGLWEVVGTPVEGAISNNIGYVTAIVTYASKSADTAEHVEIYDAHAKKVTY